MTVKDFVQLIWDELSTTARDAGGGSEALLHYGHVKGWLEDQDEAHPLATLDKRTAARIAHQFMRLELHIPESLDISEAEALKDLYTCRVCANHVAQIFVKGLMDCEEVTDPTTGNTVQIFNMLKPFDFEEAKILIEKIKQLKKDN